MIKFNAPGVGEEIANVAGIRFAPGDVSIARIENDKLLGGVIFREFTHASIQIHVASFHPKWINTDLLWVCFHYPFIQLGCSKLFGPVPASNTKALEFDLKLGFKEEARIKNVFPDGDLIILAMSRRDCRWLSIRPKTLSWQEHAHGW